MNRITLLALASILWAPTLDPVTGPAGVYTVTTTGPTRVTSGEGWVKIEWEVEPVPAPPNPAKPPEPAKPDPPPVVITPAVSIPTLAGQVWMLAVYDKTKLSDLTPAQRQILYRPDDGSAWIGTSLAKLQISWQPRDQADPVLKEWVTDAQTKGLPALVIIGNAGKSSFVVPLPADEAGVLALARKIRGQG